MATMVGLNGGSVAVESLQWNGFPNFGPIPDGLEQLCKTGAGLPELRLDAVYNTIKACEKQELFDDTNSNGFIESEDRVVNERENCVNIKQEKMDVKCCSLKGRNVLDSSEGATNLTPLHKSGDFEKDLHTFKQGVHCSQEVIVYFLNKENHNQRHDCVTVVEINRKFVDALFDHTPVITLQKKPVKKNILEFFLKENVVTKRCLVRCTSIIHGLALAAKWESLTEGLESKRANNVFSNYQRPDRVAGKNLALEYQCQYGLSNGSGFGHIETKAKVSFEIYDKQGFLSYASDKMMLKHTIFYNCGEETYFVKEKYLNAFGKIVTPKKKKAQLKRLQKVENASNL